MGVSVLCRVQVMIRVVSCGIIGKRVGERFSQSLTSVTVGDILRYVRYIAGEEAKDIETSRFFFRIYMGCYSGRGVRYNICRRAGYD